MTKNSMPGTHAPALPRIMLRQFINGHGAGAFEKLEKRNQQTLGMLDAWSRGGPPAVMAFMRKCWGKAPPTENVEEPSAPSRQELTIAGLISGDGSLLRRIEAAINAAGPRGTVRLNIDSEGGNLREAIAAFKLLKEFRRRGGTVNTHVQCLATSAAGIIALAGSTRTADRGAILCIHMPHNPGDTSYDAAQVRRILDGDANEMARARRLYERADDIAGFYAQETGKNAKGRANLSFLECIDLIQRGQEFGAGFARECGIIHGLA